MVKNLPAILETQVQSLGWEDPLEEEMATHSSILPEESHEQRSLKGYSPWVRKESNMTEQLHFHFLSDMYFTNILYHSVGYLFTLFTVSFAAQKF